MHRQPLRRWQLATSARRVAFQHDRVQALGSGAASEWTPLAAGLTGRASTRFWWISTTPPAVINRIDDPAELNRIGDFKRRRARDWEAQKMHTGMTTDPLRAANTITAGGGFVVGPVQSLSEAHTDNSRAVLTINLAFQAQ